MDVDEQLTDVDEFLIAFVARDESALYGYISVLIMGEIIFYFVFMTRILCSLSDFLDVGKKIRCRTLFCQF